VEIPEIPQHGRLEVRLETSQQRNRVGYCSMPMGPGRKIDDQEEQTENKEDKEELITDIMKAAKLSTLVVTCLLAEVVETNFWHEAGVLMTMLRRTWCVE